MFVHIDQIYQFFYRIFWLQPPSPPMKIPSHLMPFVEKLKIPLNSAAVHTMEEMSDKGEKFFLLNTLICLSIFSTQYVPIYVLDEIFKIEHLKLLSTVQFNTILKFQLS